MCVFRHLPPEPTSTLVQRWLKKGATGWVGVVPKNPVEEELVDQNKSKGIKKMSLLENYDWIEPQQGGICTITISATAVCGRPIDRRLHFPPGCLGCRFQVGDWGSLTPAHDSRSPVLLPINDLLQGYHRPLSFGLPAAIHHWYPSTLEPGLGWAGWLLSPGFFFCRTEQEFERHMLLPLGLRERRCGNQ